MIATKNSHLLKQFNIQTDGAHEEINAAQALGRHSGRQCLGKSDCVEDTVLDRQDQSSLLVVGCGDTHRSEELPNVNILSSVDATRENVRQRWLKADKESLKCVIPGKILVLGMLYQIRCNLRTISPIALGCRRQSA
jgi:hypothetical protein